MQDQCDPIYNLIEEEKFAEAIRYSQRPDMRNLPLAQALNAYCHSCCKDVRAALEIARGVMRNLHSSDNVNNALSLTLKACRSEDELASYLEALVPAFPERGAHYLSELFSLYTRMGDHKKMQLTAQKLYKATQKRNFVFWSVASMLHQGELAPTMLTVAQRMLEKAVEANPQEKLGAEELDLYVEVLCRQRKLEEAQALVEANVSKTSSSSIDDQATFEGSFGSNVQLSGLRASSLRVRLLERRISSSASAEESALHEGKLFQELVNQLAVLPDQWSAHTGIISIVVARAREGRAEGEGGVWAHAQTLHQMTLSNPRLRGPQLAKIELLRQWATTASASASGTGAGAGAAGGLPSGWEASFAPGDLSLPPCPALLLEALSLVTCYIDRWRTKQCCFSDVKKMLETIPSFAPAEAVVPALAAVEGWCQGRRRALDAGLSSQCALSAPSSSTSTSTSSSNAAQAQAPASSAGGGKKAKSKGKKDDNAPPSSSAASASPLSEEDERARGEVVEQLCALSKFTQVSTFCSTLRSQLPAPPAAQAQAQAQASRAKEEEEAKEEAEAAVEALYEGTKRLCAGGVGGEREVQPGDELLLSVSSSHRSRVKALLSSPSPAPASAPASTTNALSGGGSVPLEVSLVLAAMRWTRLLLSASEASPYAFSFRVELIEALRTVAVGEAAEVAFRLLKTKHMQHDSMMHLIVPSLLESGLFTEASAHYTRLNAFARSARLDTADMISRTFKYSNYTTGLEMSRFLIRVNNSLHLRVAAACQYLHQICNCDTGLPAVTAGSIPLAVSTHAILSDAELAALDDNSDYSLLVFADQTEAEEEGQRLQRRRELELRIRVAQLVQRVLFHALDGDVGVGIGHLATLRELVQGGASSPKASQYSRWQQRVGCGPDPPSTSASPSTAATSATATPGGRDGEGGGEGGGFEAALWGAALEGLGFALACAAVVEASIGKTQDPPSSSASAAPAVPAVKAEAEAKAEAGAEAEAEAGVLAVLADRAKDAVERSTHALNSISTLRAALACKELRNLPLPPSASAASSEGKAGAKVAAPVSPMWLRRCAALVRVLAPVPLLLHAALLSLPCSKRPKVARSGGFGSNSRKAKERESAASKHGPSKQGEAALQGDEAAMQALTKQMQAVGDANRIVAEALCKLLEHVHRNLTDSEMDLQTNDDLVPFLAAWSAVEKSGKTDFQQAAQTLSSSQLVSLQRLRDCLGSQVDALRAAIQA